MPHIHDILTLNSPVTIQSSNPKRIALQTLDRSNSPSPTAVARRLSNPETPAITQSYTKTAISHILPKNWKSPITEPAQILSAKKTTNPDSYTKTSISHILPENWKSPITAPPQENPAYAPKLSALYLTLPVQIRNIVQKETFEHVLQAAIPHDTCLQAIFNGQQLPVFETSSVRNSLPGSYSDSWSSVALRFEGHPKGQFVFQQYKEYKLVGWCHQNKVINFQPSAKSAVHMVRKPIWATLTTHNKHHTFENGKKTDTVDL